MKRFALLLMFVCLVGCSETKRKVMEQLHSKTERLEDKVIDSGADKASKTGENAVDKAAGDDQTDPDAKNRDKLKGKDGE